MADDLLRDLERLGTAWRAASAPIALSEVEAMPAPELELTVETGPTAPKRPRMTWAVAAAAVLAVAAGLVVASRRSPSSGGDHPATTVTSVDTVTTAAPRATTTSTLASSPTTTTVPLTSYQGWYFPTDAPDGFQLTRLSAALAPAPADPPSQRWVRRAGDGTPVIVTLAIDQPAPGERTDAATEVTVHGQQGVAYDSGQGMVVTWEEAGHTIVLFSFGTAANLEAVIVLAQQVELASDGRSGTLPEATGFVALPVPEAVRDAVTIEAGWERAADATVTATFRIVPNTDGLTPELFELLARSTPGLAADKESVGGIDYFLSTPAGQATNVVWFRDSFVLSVSADLPRAELLAWAQSVVPIDPSDLQRRGDEISDRAAALATFDETSFADGLHLAVKTVDGQPAALCIDGPIARCEWEPGATSYVREIDGAGRHLVVGWTPLAGDPQLAVVRPDGSGAGSPDDATLVERATTDRGQFFVFELAPGDRLSVAYVGGSVVGGRGALPGALFSY